MSTRLRTTTGLALAGVVIGMVGLAFAAVPLYRVFCQVTGYGGTTQVAEVAPATVLERRITVRFDAGTARGLPWRFAPEARTVTVRVGEERVAWYAATNRAARPVTGTATFNVTPLKAGPYFSKLACFCFEEQVLAAGESARLPVSFFIDPAIVEDPDLDDVTTITLSYTFFEKGGPAAETASAAAH